MVGHKDYVCHLSHWQTLSKGNDQHETLLGSFLSSTKQWLNVATTSKHSLPCYIQDQVYCLNPQFFVTQHSHNLFNEGDNLFNSTFWNIGFIWCILPCHKDVYIASLLNYLLKQWTSHAGGRAVHSQHHPLIFLNPSIRTLPTCVQMMKVVFRDYQT